MLHNGNYLAQICRYTWKVSLLFIQQRAKALPRYNHVNVGMIYMYEQMCWNKNLYILCIIQYEFSMIPRYFLFRGQVFIICGYDASNLSNVSVVLCSKWMVIWYKFQDCIFCFVRRNWLLKSILYKCVFLYSYSVYCILYIVSSFAIVYIWEIYQIVNALYIFGYDWSVGKTKNKANITWTEQNKEQ